MCNVSSKPSKQKILSTSLVTSLMLTGFLAPMILAQAASFENGKLELNKVYSLKQGSFSKVILQDDDGVFRLVGAPQITAPNWDDQQKAVYSSLDKSLFLPRVAVSSAEGSSVFYQARLKQGLQPGSYNLVYAAAKETDFPELKAYLHQDSFSQELEKLRQATGTMGLAVSISDKQGLMWSKGFGYSNEVMQEKLSANTPMRLASVSKTFIASALMVALDQNVIDLNADINQYLAYSVRHPKYPSQPISLAQLASHSSGISDNIQYLCSYHIPSQNNAHLMEQFGQNISLCNSNFSHDPANFIKQYVSQGVDEYNLADSFWTRPGQQYNYSNIGAGLASEVLEAATKQNFNEYVANHIFEPLGMHNSGYLQGDFSQYTKIAKNYVYVDGQNKELAPYIYPTYTDGYLASSVNDLSNYLVMIANNGKFAGTQVISSAQVENMLIPRVPLLDDESKPMDGYVGRFWDIEGDVVYHSGGDPGVASFIVLDRDSGLSAAIIVNSTDDDIENDLIELIVKRVLSLFAQAKASKN